MDKDGASVALDLDFLPMVTSDAAGVVSEDEDRERASPKLVRAGGVRSAEVPLSSV